jgi:epoxyqueuosine reductase
MFESCPHRQLTEWIKKRALELGFSACGISRAGRLDKEEDRLLDWLMKGYHGEMGYMNRNLEKRLDPAQLLEGTRSVISVLLNYYPDENLPEANNYRISRYAYGSDYHEVMKERLRILIEDLKSSVVSRQSSVVSQQSAVSSQQSRIRNSEFGTPGSQQSRIRNSEFGIFRAFVDSAPVLDKAWTEKAGLGWIGKNTCLIHPKMGSYLFVGEIFTNLELEYDTAKVNDLCGGCTKCIDACPTGAIVGPRVVDARKCLSYLTIEYKGELPLSEREKFGDWIFGCDICQEVCPWNRFAKPTQIEEFRPSEELKAMNKEKWNVLDKELFQMLFKGSAVKRTKFGGLRRNIDFLRGDVNEK